MQQDTGQLLKAVKYVAVSIVALTVAGIAGLMILSWDKDEDITGIVAPALLITILSSIVAVVAALLQRRIGKGIDQRL